MKVIYCYYKISDLKEVYNPDDYIEGIFYIQNNDDKDKIIREAEIQVVERFGNISINKPTNEITSSKRKMIQKYSISREYKVRSGETKEYPFKFKLERWTPKKKWFLELVFKARIGLKLTSGRDENSTIFYIPVDGAHPKIPFKSINTTEKKEKFTSCSECGSKIDGFTKFCEFCGKRQ